MTITMNQNSTKILNARQVEQKINRMAYEIYENNFEHKGLIIAGIANRGYKLAQLLAEKLKEMFQLEVELAEVKVNKRDPFSSQATVIPANANFDDKVVVLVDDVLNTGRTLAFGAMPFLQHRVKKLQAVVLVNRDHTSFPVKPDIEGITLATTLQEHVTVEFNKGVCEVFLS